MGIGLLLGGAGAVAEGRREHDETLRRARLEQLRMQEANRINAARRRAVDTPRMQDSQALVQGLLNTEEDQAPLPGLPKPPAPKPARVGVATPPARTLPPITTPAKAAGVAPVPAGTFTREDYLALSPAERAARLQVENDRRYGKSVLYGGPGVVGGTAMDIVTSPLRGLEMIAQGIGNSRFGQAVGLTDPGKPWQFVREETFPARNAAVEAAKANWKDLTEEEYIASLPSRTVQKEEGEPRALEGNFTGVLEGDVDYLIDSRGRNHGDLARMVQFSPEEQAIMVEEAKGDPFKLAFLELALRIENRGNERLQYDAVSGKKAEGPYQFIPSTAKLVGVTKPRDFRNATQGAVRLFDDMRSRHGDNMDAILADYNGSPSAAYQVKQGRYDSLSKETRQYLAIAHDLYGNMGATTSAPAELQGTAPGTAAVLAGQGPAPGATATLAATNPQQIVAQGAAGVQTPAEAAPRRKIHAGDYYGNPRQLSAAIQQQIGMRDELMRMADIYQQSGMGGEYMDIRQQIMQLDAGLVDLAGMQGIYDLEQAGKVGQLARAISQKTGIPTQLRMRDDNTVDVMVAGQPMREGVPADEVIGEAMSMFSPKYGERKAAQADEGYKSYLRIQEEGYKSALQTHREILLETLKGDIEVAKTRLANAKWDVKDAYGGQFVALTPPDGGPPFLWSPQTREIMTINGEKIMSDKAFRPAGLTP